MISKGQIIFAIVVVSILAGWLVMVWLYSPEKSTGEKIGMTIGFLSFY